MTGDAATHQMSLKALLVLARLYAGFRLICFPSAVDRGDVTPYFGWRTGAQTQDGRANLCRYADLENPTEVAGDRGLPGMVKEALGFTSLESNLLQAVFARTMRSCVGGGTMQPVNSQQGTINDAAEFSAEFRRSLFDQAVLRLLGGEPGGISISFLRRF